MPSASEWTQELTRLREIKPRPLHKLYGRNGPTPEQKTAWEEKMKAWNKLYRHASKMQKEQLVIDNENFRRQQAERLAAKNLRAI